MNKEARPVSGLSCVTNVRKPTSNIKHNIPIAKKKENNDDWTSI
jgi:hypothetical protein